MVVATVIYTDPGVNNRIGSTRRCEVKPVRSITLRNNIFWNQEKWYHLKRIVESPRLWNLILWSLGFPSIV